MSEQRNLPDGDLRRSTDAWLEEEGQTFGAGYAYGRSARREGVKDVGPEMLTGHAENSTAGKDQSTRDGMKRRG